MFDVQAGRVLYRREAVAAIGLAESSDMTVGVNSKIMFREPRISGSLIKRRWSRCCGADLVCSHGVRGYQPWARPDGLAGPILFGRPIDQFTCGTEIFR